MGSEHEDAKDAARLEVTVHGDRLPLSRRMELRDLVWATADQGERAALRAEYTLAGWTVCPHTDCPPHDCRA